jgi:transposase-like protein
MKRTKYTSEFKEEAVKQVVDILQKIVAPGL